MFSKHSFESKVEVSDQKCGKNTQKMSLRLKVNILLLLRVNAKNYFFSSDKLSITGLLVNGFGFCKWSTDEVTESKVVREFLTEMSIKEDVEI